MTTKLLTSITEIEARAAAATADDYDATVDRDLRWMASKLRRAVDLLVAANTLFGESRSILEAERPDVMHAISAFLSGEGER